MCVNPLHLFGPEAVKYLTGPSSDCANTGGEHPPSQGNPGCYKGKPLKFANRIQGDFPHVEATNHLDGDWVPAFGSTHGSDNRRSPPDAPR